MGRYAVIYLATLLAIGVLDALWLGLVATNLYKSGIGHLMAAKPNIPAAAAFYFIYPIGVVFFAALPAQEDWARALLLGALFGFFCYGTYDATSMAVLRDWPLKITLIDVAWGAVVTAAGAIAGTLAAKWMG